MASSGVGSDRYDSFACPFQGATRESCLASVGGSDAVRVQRPARCTSSDHDGCPIYLAKLLRSLRPHPVVGDRDLWSK